MFLKLPGDSSTEMTNSTEKLIRWFEALFCAGRVMHWIKKNYVQQHWKKFWADHTQRPQFQFQRDSVFGLSLQMFWINISMFRLSITLLGINIWNGTFLTMTWDRKLGEILRMRVSDTNIIGFNFPEKNHASYCSSGCNFHWI